MNTNLKTSALALAAVLTLTTATAQKNKKDTERKRKSITVVTTNDGDSTEKMTIVVDGDKVTINGKPAEDYKGSDVRVITGSDNFKIAAPSRVWSQGKGPRAPMAIADMKLGAFSWNGNSAVLGVSSEDAEGGAKITELTKDGAAEKAGLKVGDVITKVNDFNVADSDDLPMAIGKFKPEEKVTVTYKRDGKEQSASATLLKNKNSFSNSFAIADHDFAYNFENDNVVRAYGFGKPRLGLQIEDLEEGNGVKVLDVNEDSPAAKAGLKKDDVIISFDGKEIKGVDDIRSAMRDVEAGETIKVSLKRGSSAQNIDIKFPKPVKKASL